MTYGKERKEEILGRFHASGMSMRAACRALPGFPCSRTLSAPASEEEAGLLDPAVSCHVAPLAALRLFVVWADYSRPASFACVNSVPCASFSRKANVRRDRQIFAPTPLPARPSLREPFVASVSSAGIPRREEKGGGICSGKRDAFAIMEADMFCLCLRGPAGVPCGGEHAERA